MSIPIMPKVMHRQDQAHAIRLGAQDYLLKPLLFIEVLRKVQHLMTHRKLAWENQLLQEGLFQRARGGTIFLDEIGDMPLSLQPKLLLVLEGKQFCRSVHDRGKGQRAYPRRQQP